MLLLKLCIVVTELEYLHDRAVTLASIIYLQLELIIYKHIECKGDSDLHFGTVEKL